jgi:HD-GYP domain-containing protein (c-di-GMP phosphodiesterase class II)
MTTDLLSATDDRPATALSPADSASRDVVSCWSSRRLKRAFGVEFDLVDAASGELLQRSADQPRSDWSIRGELCREVARRGRAEIIQDEDPFLLLALPLSVPETPPAVAVATFVGRSVSADEDVSRSARCLGIDPLGASSWAAAQIPWAPQTLQRMADMVLEQFAGKERIEKLEREAESISVHLASTYEEISLLYRLTRNLRISQRDEDLANAALQWMIEVVPAQGLAIQLSPLADDADPVTQNTRTAPVLLTFGDCPTDAEQFNRLIEHLDLSTDQQPRVVNRNVTDQQGWPFPGIDQAIVVPLTEGENLFGYLAAFNHVDHQEFGTVEASLLGSVGAILGIHSGNIELYRQQAELLAGIVRALTSAIDAKDPYTCGHSDRVAQISVRLAQELNCDGEMLNTIYLSGLLHDIGKIGVEDLVLRKPGSLTELEFERIKEHPTIGHRILVDLKRLDDVLPVVLHHHEYFNGKGYPLQLAGDQIPLSARIVSVADAFDAMASARPYRNVMPDAKIDEIFRNGSGTQWDPMIVDALFRARDDIGRIAATSGDDGNAGTPAWR